MSVLVRRCAHDEGWDPGQLPTPEPVQAGTLASIPATSGLSSLRRRCSSWIFAFSSELYAWSPPWFLTLLDFLTTLT
jgi:hypothetical protein